MLSTPLNFHFKKTEERIDNYRWRHLHLDIRRTFFPIKAPIYFYL